MVKLPSNRGDLPIKMKITNHDGEEFLSFRGSEMIENAARLIAEWIITGENPEETDPVDLITVAKTQTKGKWRCWMAGGGNIDPADAKAICAGMEEVLADRRLIVLSHELVFYNLARADENRLKPVAVIGHYYSRASELKFLYGTLDEAAGLIYKIRGLRLGDNLDARSVRKFFEVTSMQKKAAEKKTSDAGQESAEPEDETAARQKALIRAFEAQSRVVRW